jgi:1,2-dihydroxy-3-keto-5-methylthiopentene dioxygenase
MILPAGIYHRFTPGQSDFAHAMRLFKDEPKWTAYPRKDGADFPERAEYVQQIGLVQ